jgi:hypothetical protein
MNWKMIEALRENLGNFNKALPKVVLSRWWGMNYLLPVEALGASKGDCRRSISHCQSSSRVRGYKALFWWPMNPGLCLTTRYTEYQNYQDGRLGIIAGL